MLKQLVFAAIVAAFGIGTAYATDCQETEQRGCIELDFLNLRFDPRNPAMAGLDQPAGGPDEEYNRAISLGPALYREYQAGQASSAGSQTFYVYFWNVDNTPTTKMSAYRLQQRDGTTSRHEVQEVSVTVGPAAGAEFGIGPPHRAFQVSTSTAGAAIQVPWSMVGPNTYVLVCPNGRTVYPNRRTADQGMWFTPEYLNDIRRRGWEYSITAFLS